jgi:hypothetical protein
MDKRKPFIRSTKIFIKQQQSCLKECDCHRFFK